MTSELITEIFQVVLIPLLGVLTAYIVKFINAKAEELKTGTNDELAQKYITMLSETITSCVIATNQTYVDSLKKQGKFDAEAQKQAFQMTFEAIMSVLNEEAVTYLTSVYGDLNTYITNKIEAIVNEQKK